MTTTHTHISHGSLSNDEKLSNKAAPFGAAFQVRPFIFYCLKIFRILL